MTQRNPGARGVTPSDGPSGSADPDTVARTIRTERRRRGFSVEQLAAMSGISGNVLLDMEQARRLPTVYMLDRIATSLGTSVGRLLRDERPAGIVVLRRHEQNVAWHASGWERRVLSPVLPGIEFEFVRATIDAGVYAGVFAPHRPGAREYLAVESGTLRLSMDGESTDLRAGDSVTYSGDCQHGFFNPGIGPCIYYLATDLASMHRDAVMVPVNPEHALSVEDYMRCLHLLRIRAGCPSLAFLAKRTGLPKSTLHDGLHMKRDTLPTLDLVRRVVSVLEPEPVDVEPWVDGWRRLSAQRLNQRTDNDKRATPARRRS